jgi:hypothetical protein
MKQYAEGTAVSVERSRTEVETVLNRYGATKFMYYREGDSVILAFEMNGHACKLSVRPPDRESFRRTETGRTRKSTAAQDAWEAEYRRRWRVLILSLKARLESISAEAETFEEAFAGIMLLRSGETVAENMRRNPSLSGVLSAPLMLTEGDRS